MANERIGAFTEEEPKAYLQGLFTISATQKHRLGTKRRISDGREFVYAKAGGANLAAGFVEMAPVADPTNTANLAIPANTAAGERSLQVTLGDTTLANTADNLAEGYLYINTGSGVIGDLYKIRGHAAAAANANCTFNLFDGIRTALTTSHKASIVMNPYKGVLLANGAGCPVGVACVDITTLYYGWLQTKGPCAVLTDGTLIAGDMAFLSETAAEAMPSSGNAIDDIKIPKLGKVLQVNANDHASIIDLNL